MHFVFNLDFFWISVHCNTSSCGIVMFYLQLEEVKPSGSPECVLQLRQNNWFIFCDNDGVFNLGNHAFIWRLERPAVSSFNNRFCFS